MTRRRIPPRFSACRDRCLLANVLTPTVGQKRADDIAAQLLEDFDLPRIAKEDGALLGHLGLEPKAIAALTAAFELSTRLMDVRFVAAKVDLKDAESVASFLAQGFRVHEQEAFGALFFDLGSRLISAEELFRGAGSACSVDVRVLMRRALLLSATSLILWHSHPSGTTEPSLHDIELSKRVARAGEQLEVRLIDHLIVAPDGSFTSMRRKRCW